MSTATLELDELHSSDCAPDCECVRQGVGPASIHGLIDWSLWKLMRVIKGQQEESDLPPNGWWDIWCLECDETAEPFQGTLEQSAVKFRADGWDVLDAVRLRAICLACTNKEDDSHYASQYQTNEGVLG